MSLRFLPELKAKLPKFREGNNEEKENIKSQVGAGHFNMHRNYPQRDTMAEWIGGLRRPHESKPNCASLQAPLTHVDFTNFSSHYVDSYSRYVLAPGVFKWGRVAPSHPRGMWLFWVGGNVVKQCFFT